MNIYALYDTQNDEMLVAIGSMKEIINFTGSNTNNIRSCLSRGQKVNRRYEIKKIEVEDD